MNYKTGYFASIWYRSKAKVHVVYNNTPLCGYRPAKSLTFQRCANGIYSPYVNCKACTFALLFINEYD